MEKNAFLTKVAEVMKGMISHETMMEAIHRSCMRGEEENLRLMEREKDNIDRLIEGIEEIIRPDVPEDVMDILVLRYLKNTQFLAKIKEDDIDVSGLDTDLSYWKKTMLFQAP